MRNWFRPLKWEDIEKNPIYQDADRYSEEFEPKDNVDYSWIYNHSLQLFSDITSHVIALDSKAENLIRYLGPGSGLIGIAIAWFNTQGSNCLYVNILVGAGLIFLVISIISALLSLMPHHQAISPGVKDAIEVAEYYSDKNNSSKVLAAFATGIDTASEIKRIVVLTKASYLNFSYWFLFIGLVSLITGILLAIW